MKAIDEGYFLILLSLLKMNENIQNWLEPGEGIVHGSNRSGA